MNRKTRMHVQPRITNAERKFLVTRAVAHRLGDQDYEVCRDLAERYSPKSWQPRTGDRTHDQTIWAYGAFLNNYLANNGPFNRVLLFKYLHLLWGDSREANRRHQWIIQYATEVVSGTKPWPEEFKRTNP